MAATASKIGAEVSVYHNGQAVLARSVPPQVADIIAARHRAEGVHLHLGATVQSADATSITLGDGLTRTFDCVITGIGAVPNVELAQDAGLSVENGIQVDESFCTSAPDIYAAGDCCNFPWRGTRLAHEQLTTRFHGSGRITMTNPYKSPVCSRVQGPRTSVILA
jgi:3-phenylpropionate/trans-cinnamate dioxygenase ferredoxin reductase subunit